MGHIYRIGSFNLCDIGEGALEKGRNLETIAKIIKDENLDIVALQEVLRGKALPAKDTPSNLVRESILGYLGGDDKWGGMPG